MSTLPPLPPPRRRRDEPPPWRAILSALVAVLVVVGGIGGIALVDDDHDGRPDHVKVPLPVTPSPFVFDANTPGGPPAAASDDLPGVPEARERELERKTARAAHKPYDTSGVLKGAAGQGAEFKCYTPQNGGPRPISSIALGVVHVTVSRNVRGTSDGFALCDFFRHVQASPTWTVDNEGHSWENVPLDRVPWTQAWFNRPSCSIEFVGSTGRLGEGPAEWTTAQYREGARLMAGCFARAHIPPRNGAVNTAVGYVVTSGIISHQELGLKGGGHTDPGPYFNRVLFRALVAGYMNGYPPITARQRARCHELNGIRRRAARTGKWTPHGRANKIKAAERKHHLRCRLKPPTGERHLVRRA